MPYVEGKWGRIGLEIGEAQGRYKREQAYQQDRARALAETQAELEVQKRRIDQQEPERAAEAEGGLAPGAQGPVSVDEQRVHDRFAILRSVAGKLSPENVDRYLTEEKERMRAGAMTRARKKVAEGIQDRLAHGAFNFLDETEINPAIDARVEMLSQALDSEQTDPLKAAEAEASILEAVRKENESRLSRRRGTAMIEQKLAKAVDSGNTDLAGRYETLHAMWGTGELKPDDLVDKLFEAEYGRKTARAAGPTEFDLRKEAVRLWFEHEKGQPTEEGLQRYMSMLQPGASGFPAPGKKAVVAAITSNGGARGQGAPEGGAAPPQAAAVGKDVGNDVGRRAATEPTEGDLARFGASAAKRSGRKEEGGQGPRAWAKLKPVEQRQAEKDLIGAAKKGVDPAKAIQAAGLLTIPRALLERLKAAYKSGGGPTLGEAVSHLHPGAGGM